MDDNRTGGPAEGLGEATTRLGTQPITRLIIAFSLPVITANIVNALYNIIDRIFVGRGVGETALGGISLVMPIMTVMMAFSILFGAGAANLISLRLGEGRREEAQSAANHCFWLLVIMGVIIIIVGHIFIDPILSILGAQEGSESIEYGRVFIRIIFFGAVFQQLAMGVANIVRSQGYPMLVMGGLLVSMVLNAVLVAFFIFGLHWGVAGSAWATVIAQAVAAVWFVGFASSKKVPLRLTPFRFRLSGKSVLRILSFGSAQAVVQFAMSFVIAFMNARVSLYGVRELDAEHGGDVALSSLTIYHSSVMIVFMIIFGLSMGSQPIFGYNYGAKQFGRVAEAYKKTVLYATAIAIIGFVIMHFFADPIIHLYAPGGSAPLIDFAIRCMRYATVALPVVGFQVVSAGFFVATGRPNTSLFLSMSRQVIFLIPLILVLGEKWGLMGVVMANPVSDFLSTLVTAIAVVFEFRRLRRVRRIETLDG
jgi:putative MATE family efflux protein